MHHLAAFLREQVFPRADEVVIRALDRPSGGASWETFIAHLTVVEGDTGRPERIMLKRAPASGPMAPYEVGKDVAILGTLERSALPVPRLLAWTEDPAVFERPFTVQSFVDGEGPDLAVVERWPRWQASRSELGAGLVDVAAGLARVEWRGTALADALGAGGDASVRVVRVIDRYLVPLLELSERHGLPQPFVRDVAWWLKTRTPPLAEEELALVHGDLRFGNLLFDGTAVAAVIDWERAMIGDPMANLGFIAMPMSRLGHPHLLGKAVTVAELVDRYERHHGLVIDWQRVHYYTVFWQFLEAVNSTRNVAELVLGRRAEVSSRGLLSPTLLERQTLGLIEDHDAGRHELG